VFALETTFVLTVILVLWINVLMEDQDVPEMSLIAFLSCLTGNVLLILLTPWTLQLVSISTTKTPLLISPVLIPMDSHLLTTMFPELVVNLLATMAKDHNTNAQELLKTIISVNVKL
jgi:hypothetical protein